MTRIHGANGSGKSSILRALAFVFEGGSDPSVIRKGAAKSVIEIKLDNGVTITKTTAPIKPRKAKRDDPDPPTKYESRTEIVDSDETPVPAPQTYINELSAALAVDPSILLRIDTTTAPGRKQLADTLIKLVPISFEPEEIQRAWRYVATVEVPTVNGRTGEVIEPAGREIVDDDVAIPVDITGPLDLDGLKKLVARTTEQRRRIGQRRDDADGAVNQLQRALPEGTEDGPALTTALDEAEEYRRGVEGAVAERKTQIEQQKAGAVLEARNLLAEAESAVNSDVDARLKALEAERSQRLNDARATHGTQLSKIDDLTRNEYHRLESESGPVAAQAIEEVTKAKERVNAFHRAAGLRDRIATEQDIFQANSRRYDRLSRILQNLESLRLEKLNGLPVRGLVVEDGNAYLDEWKNVNLARRVEAVLEICTQQTGKLPFVLLDDSEHSTRETRRLRRTGPRASRLSALGGLRH